MALFPEFTTPESPWVLEFIGTVSVYINILLPGLGYTPKERATDGQEDQEENESGSNAMCSNRNYFS